MEQLQTYRLESAAPRLQSSAAFGFVRDNEPFKDENTLIAMGGFSNWELYLNPAMMVAEPVTGVPVNVMTVDMLAEGLLVAQQQVD